MINFQCVEARDCNFWSPRDVEIIAFHRSIAARSNGLGSGQSVLFNVLTELKAKVAGNP